MKFKIKVICFMCCNLLLLLFVGCGKDYNESSVEVQTTANAEMFGVEHSELSLLDRSLKSLSEIFSFLAVVVDKCIEGWFRRFVNDIVESCLEF